MRTLDKKLLVVSLSILAVSVILLILSFTLGPQNMAEKVRERSRPIWFERNVPIDPLLIEGYRVL